MTTTGAQGERIAALSYELEDAVALWAAGRAHLQQMRPDGAGVVLSLLAAGAEKLLKLTLGLSALDTEGRWPSVHVMRQRWGHRIAELDEQVRALLLERIHLSNAQPFIRALLGRTETDPIRAELFGTLQDYASAGRFAHLDTLAGSTPDVPSPRQRWDGLASELVLARPQLLAGLAGPQQDFDACLAELAGLLDESLRWWQYALYRCWQHGLAGAEARRWSAHLSIAEPSGLVIGDG